jgi:hypothetical protein
MTQLRERRKELFSPGPGGVCDNPIVALRFERGVIRGTLIRLPNG